jgi:hypothetical protein
VDYWPVGLFRNLFVDAEPYFVDVFPVAALNVRRIISKLRTCVILCIING